MSTTVAPKHPATLESIQALRSLYALADAPAVASFLSRHPELSALLIEAHQRIGRHFPGHHLSLSAVADPEQDTEPRLRIGITTRLDGETALERLGRLDEEWWLDTLPRAGRFLFINLDFEDGENG